MGNVRRTAALAVALAGITGAGLTTMTPSATVAGPAKTAPPTASLQKAVAARQALVQYLKHSNPLNIPGNGSAIGTTGSSYNWGGYVDTNNSAAVPTNTTTTSGFTHVSGSWTVPTMTCTDEQRMTAEWVGIDGYDDGTVEQDGTFGWCFEGSAYYYSWWEMYPTNSAQFVGESVEPGDVISATVNVSGTNYALTVTDSTTAGNDVSENETCTSCANASAEWIEERPGTAIGETPLAKTTNWNVTNGLVTDNGVHGTISSFNPVGLSMIDVTKSYDLTNPSELNATGKAFTSKWENSW
jgi:hypothetical protein